MKDVALNLEKELFSLSLNCSIENLNNSIKIFESYSLGENSKLRFALESYENQEISIEGFLDTIKAFWEKIVKFLKNLWNRIKEFIESNFTLLGRRRKEIDKLRKNVLEIKDSIYTRKIKEQHKTFEVSNANVRGLHVNKQFVKNYTELVKGLEETHKAIEFLAGPYAQAIDKRANLLKQAINKANVENSKDVFNELVEQLTNNKIKDESFDLLGNYKLEYHNVKGEIESVADLRQMKANLEDLGSITEKTYSFTTMESTELVDVLTQLGQTIDLMEQFRNGKYKDILKTQSELINTTDKYINKLTNYIKKGSDGDDHVSSQISRDLMNLNSVYLDWIKSPVISTIQSITKAFIQISRECEKNYFFYDLSKADLSKTLIDLFELKGKENVVEGKKQLNSVKPTNKLHVFYTDDPCIGYTGGACCSITFKMILEKINTWISEAEEKEKVGVSLSYPNFLKELKQLQSTLSIGDGIVLISNKLKEKLTPEEIIAIRDHEYGHYFNQDWLPVEKDFNDMEIAADAYSLKNSKPSVLQSALVKALNFGVTDTIVFIKDSILKSDPNWLVKKIVTNRFIIESNKGLLISLAKRMHNRRLKTLNKLVKEEKANK